MSDNEKQEAKEENPAGNRLEILEGKWSGVGVFISPVQQEDKKDGG